MGKWFLKQQKDVHWGHMASVPEASESGKEFETIRVILISDYYLDFSGEFGSVLQDLFTFYKGD